MYRITTLNSAPKQQLKMLLESNNFLTLKFEFKPQQLGWFFGFEYGDINYQNIRLVTRYNILRAYKSYLPFGIRCDTLDGQEPMNMDDFSTGYATVYILTQGEVQATEATYYAKTTANLRN